MGNPDTRERLRTAGPFSPDGLLAVVMAAVGFALLASALPFDPGSPRAWAGVRVEVRIEGTPAELPAGLELSAYRIVQEALTNVARHAGPATARVAVSLPLDESGSG